eukprot:9866818-Prorocentrum_lima.AAC.1
MMLNKNGCDQPWPTTAKQMAAVPIAAGVEGVTRNQWHRFATYQGCPLGRRCQYEHPKDCPGK